MVVPVVEVLAVEVVEPRFTPIPVAVRETWVAAGGLVAAVLVAGEVPAVSGTAKANAKTTIILLNAITFILTKIFKIKIAIELPCQWPDAGPNVVESILGQRWKIGRA